MTEDNRVSISGGTFSTQGAISVGAGSSASAQVSGRQELPETLTEDEVLALRSRIAELERQLGGPDAPGSAGEREAVQLQAGLIGQALGGAGPNRKTLLTLLSGMAESAKALTGIGEFAARLVKLVSTGVF